MGDTWLEGELGSEAMMALGDLLREGTPFTLLQSTPHLEGFQPLLDWGYIRCAGGVEKVARGTKIISITPEGRRYYTELRLRANALERETRAIEAAVSAAKFTALAAIAALIAPVQETVEHVLQLFGVSAAYAHNVATVMELVLVGFVGFCGYRFYKGDKLLGNTQ